jgi:3-dehydroquinate synthetase
MTDRAEMRDEMLLTFDTPLSPSCPYYLCHGALNRFPDHVKQHDFDRCFVISSKKLMDLLGTPFLDGLCRAGIPCDVVLIKETEQHKSWQSLRKLCERLVSHGATKNSILIAFGGGLIGNVVGLAAALLYRGIRFVSVPTTITAQTDSALSNKQAINGRHGKNQFGVFHAPLFIWADAAYALAEPKRQQRGGVVEGIKNVFISRTDTGHAETILDAWRADDHFGDLLRLIIESKLAILRQDPTERRSSVILEYGHTFGHAIEWLAAGRLFHGEAVSIGMCLAAELSHALGFMDEAFLLEHYRLLGKELGTPTRLPDDIATDDLCEAMRFDNKRTGKGLRFLLLEKCGEFVKGDGDHFIAVPEEVLRETLGRSHQS